MEKQNTRNTSKEFDLKTIIQKRDWLEADYQHQLAFLRSLIKKMPKGIKPEDVKKYGYPDQETLDQIAIAGLWIAQTVHKIQSLGQEEHG